MHVILNFKSIEHQGIIVAELNFLRLLLGCSVQFIDYFLFLKKQKVIEFLSLSNKLRRFEILDDLFVEEGHFKESQQYWVRTHTREVLVGEIIIHELDEKSIEETCITEIHKQFFLVKWEPQKVSKAPMDSFVVYPNNSLVKVNKELVIAIQINSNIILGSLSSIISTPIICLLHTVLMLSSLKVGLRLVNLLVRYDLTQLFILQV